SRFHLSAQVRDQVQYTLHTRAATEWRLRLTAFANHRSTRTWPALRRSPARGKIPHHPRRARLGYGSLPQRRANPQSARSRTTADTLSESARVFVPFPATTPSSSPR